ncbi:GNAT family N-acetyltransferase [Sinomicrobium sp. M5D2P17]
MADKDFYIKEIPGAHTWPMRHRVMYPEMSPDSVILEEDADGIHFGLFSPDHRLVSVISLFERENDHYQFRKFATDTSEQGKGYGSALLSYIIDFCRAKNARGLRCNARRSASSFYKRFGFGETDTTYFKDGHDFVVMEREL